MYFLKYSLDSRRLCLEVMDRRSGLSCTKRIIFRRRLHHSIGRWRWTRVTSLMYMRPYSSPGWIDLIGARTGRSTFTYAKRHWTSRFESVISNPSRRVDCRLSLHRARHVKLGRLDGGGATLIQRLKAQCRDTTDQFHVCTASCMSVRLSVTIAASTYTWLCEKSRQSSTFWYSVWWSFEKNDAVLEVDKMQLL